MPVGRDLHKTELAIKRLRRGHFVERPKAERMKGGATWIASRSIPEGLVVISQMPRLDTV